MRRFATLGILLAVVGVAGCSGGKGDLPVTPAPTSQSPEPEESPIETATPVVEAARGSRANPLTPGESRKISDESAFTVSGGATTFDAWPTVQAENQFNTPPADGRSYIMFPLSVAIDWPTIQKQAADDGSTTDGGFSAQYSLTVAFVGTDGISYGSNEADYCGVIPNDWMSVNPVFDSATVTGNVCVSAPTQVIPGGTWVVSNVVNDAVFVAAQ
ncbi:hypothetical protein GXP71_07995 [Cellulomonas sp. H30R-01]|uniref:hypothetical protein n=1 Tax=Cellulomonas TaxID=1707 RepID=UPI00138B8B3E|nr:MULTISPECIES: hypothetical protein [Cellulomonas]QHT56023.1 hypothetical protein GXP71_07995 [Cellulomonas sp. H30R-01]